MESADSQRTPKRSSPNFLNKILDNAKMMSAYTGKGRTTPPACVEGGHWFVTPERSAKKIKTHANMCDMCDHADCVVVPDGDENGMVGSMCGQTCTYQVPSKDATARNFKDDDQKTKDSRVHHVAHDDEMRRHLVHIAPKEIKSTDDDLLHKVNNRLNQCKVLLTYLRDERPGHFWLWEGEMKTALIRIRQACVQWGLGGCEQEFKGSPLFWVITMARQMVAERENGFAMPTEKLRDQVSVEGLYDYLLPHAGESQKTDESECAVTRGGGVDARLANQSKYRQARIDSLGATRGERTAKVAFLNQLLIKAGVHEAPGFAKAVRQGDDPALFINPRLARQARSFAPIAVGDGEPPPSAPPSPPPPDESSVGWSEAELTSDGDATGGADDNGSDLGSDYDDSELLDDDDIWETLAGESGGAAPEGVAEDEGDEDEDEEEEEPPKDAIVPRHEDTDAGLWAAIEASASKGVVDEQPPSLKQPRRVRIPDHKLKHASARQVFASSQFNQSDRTKADAFFKRWQVEQKAHREKVNEGIARRKSKEAQRAKKKADRLALQKARHLEKEAELAEKRDSRGFDQLMRQGAVKEKAEARVARGQGVTYIVPSEEMPDKKAGILPKIRIGQIVPTIKVSAKVMQKASALLSAKGKGKARVQDPCPYFRVYKARERK